MSPRIFISMGTPYRDDQLRFRDELESFLRNECGTDPRIIGKNEYPAGNPLTKIKEVMSACDGVVVVAYERKLLSTGIERRGGSAEKPLEDLSYTTPWNHVESALAFALNLPLYIICEHNLAEEGLIESKLDWYVQRVHIDPAEFTRPNVRESLRTWVEQRVRAKARGLKSLRSFTGKFKFSEMTPEELGWFFGSLAAAFGAGVIVTKASQAFFH